MDREKTADLLADTKLFGELDRKTLIALAEKCVERRYRKGQMVFYQGDRGDALYIIVEGLVKVVVTSEDGDEMVLVTLEPPDVLGEIAVVDGGSRSASAEIVANSTLLSLTRDTFLDLLHGHKEMTESLLRSLGGALRRLTEQTADLVFLDLHGRVAKLLLHLGGQSTERTALDLQLTQTDLASMVGGSRQSVNQILRSFERQGYVAMEGRRIVIKNAERLMKRAGL